MWIWPDLNRQWLLRAGASPPEHHRCQRSFGTYCLLGLLFLVLPQGRRDNGARAGGHDLPAVNRKLFETEERMKHFIKSFDLPALCAAMLLSGCSSVFGP